MKDSDMSDLEKERAINTLAQDINAVIGSIRHATFLATKLLVDKSENNENLGKDFLEVFARYNTEDPQNISKEMGDFSKLFARVTSNEYRNVQLALAKTPTI